MSKSRVLFIVKYNDNCLTNEYGAYGYHRKFSGLYNSARFVQEMLQENGIDARIVHAIDNNCIDRLVTDNDPETVIIEAYWVVPEKFEVLKKLHPKVNWVIRIHSEIPFFACEGSSMGWTLRYLKETNVTLAPNAERIYDDIKKLAKHMGRDYERRVIYLPNYYKSTPEKSSQTANNEEVHVGCFGAIRPLKNHLCQALAAIQFADSIGKSLVFHINGTRVEGSGEPVLHNLRGLFANLTKHKLVEHAWLSHDDFKKLICTMDFGMQCSFTETFNIVTADLVTAGVPVVVSEEVAWLPWWTKADPTSVHDIFLKLKLVAALHKFHGEVANKWALDKIVNKAKRIWLEDLQHKYI